MGVAYVTAGFGHDMKVASHGFISVFAGVSSWLISCINEHDSQ